MAIQKSDPRRLHGDFRKVAYCDSRSILTRKRRSNDGHLVRADGRLCQTGDAAEAGLNSPDRAEALTCRENPAKPR